MKNSQRLVLTFVDNDRPGLVQQIASVVAEHQGNWLTSRMTQLDGKFAGLVRIDAPESNAAALRSALEAQASQSLIIAIEEIEGDTRENTHSFELDIVGNDRSGIIHEVTRALAEHNLNLVELNSDIARAAMTGAPMFSCMALIEVDEQLDLEILQNQLASIGGELNLDIQFTRAMSNPVRGK